MNQSVVQDSQLSLEEKQSALYLYLHLCPYIMPFISRSLCIY